MKYLKWNVDTPEETHIGHALLALLVGGSLGIIVSIFTHFTMPFALGVGNCCGLLFFFCHEFYTVIKHPDRWWDSMLDALFPAYVLFPWSLLAITQTVPVWSAWLLYGLGVIVAFFYMMVREA